MTDRAATVLNFTLTSAKLEIWSKNFDFGVHENLQKEAYMKMDAMEDFLKEIESDNPYIVSSMDSFQSSHGKHAF